MDFWTLAYAFAQKFIIIIIFFYIFVQHQSIVCKLGQTNKNWIAKQWSKSNFITNIKQCEWNVVYINYGLSDQKLKIIYQLKFREHSFWSFHWIIKLAPWASHKNKHKNTREHANMTKWISQEIWTLYEIQINLASFICTVDLEMNERMSIQSSAARKWILYDGAKAKWTCTAGISNMIENEFLSTSHRYPMVSPVCMLLRFKRIQSNGIENERSAVVSLKWMRERKRQRGRERESRENLTTEKFMFHAKYIYNDLLRRYFLSIKFNVIRFSWYRFCVCVSICCYRLLFFVVHFVVAHVHALDSNCQCCVGFVCIFSSSLLLRRMYKYKCITRARRNFHFYWRHIKCMYYIMVHSFSIWICVIL